MQQSYTAYSAPPHTESPDVGASPNGSPLPSPHAGMGLTSQGPRRTSSASSSYEISQDPSAGCTPSISGMSRGRDATVAPVPALTRKPMLSGGHGLRRPKRVLMGGPVSGPNNTSSRVMGMSTLMYPQAMLSPIGTGLSRQTSPVNHSRVGMRTAPPSGLYLSLSPSSPATESLSAQSGLSRRWQSSAELLPRRVGPPTYGTKGDQMGRNLDSHVYLQTHVMSGGHRLLLSPSQHPHVSAPAGPAGAGGGGSPSTTGLVAGVPSPRSVGAGGSGGSVFAPAHSITERSTPLVGTLGMTASSSNTALLMHPSHGEHASFAAVANTSAATTGARRATVTIGTSSEPINARYDMYRARPTSPLSTDTTTRHSGPMSPADMAIVSRLPSTTFTATAPAAEDYSGLRRTRSVMVPDAGLSSSPAGTAAGGSPRRSRLDSSAAPPISAHALPPPPTPPIAQSFCSGKVDDLQDLLRSSASAAGRSELAGVSAAAAFGQSTTGAWAPNELSGDTASLRGSRLASPIQDPLAYQPRPGLSAAGSTTEGVSRRRGVFGLFGLLERNSRFEELYDLYASQPCLRGFHAAIKEHVEDISRLDRMSWMVRSFQTIFFFLDHPSEAQKVGLEYYRNPMIAWPLHVLYLVSCYRVTAEQYGFTALHEAITNTGGLLAMGKGLFAAIAVAMSVSETTLAMNTARMMCAAFTTGVVMRRRLDAWEAHMDTSVSRSFSLLLVNIPISTLRQLVDEVNECRGIDFAAVRARTGHGGSTRTGGGVNKDAFEKSATASTFPGRRLSRNSQGDGSAININNQEKYAAASHNRSGSTTGSLAAVGSSDVLPRTHLEVSRVISSRAAVVCGHPLDLDRLDIVLTRFANSTGVKIHKDFIPSCAPENSSYYNEDMAFELLACWQYSNTAFDPHDLHVPLFSPVQGERWSLQTLRTPDAFAKQVAEAVTYRNQDLTYSLQHIADGDCLLDFTTMPLTMGAVVEWTNKQFEIISVPANRRERAMLPPPRRSQQPSGVRGTLSRLALVNVVLDSLIRDGIIKVPSAWRRDVADGGTRRADGKSHGTPTGTRLACGVQLSTTFEELGLVLYVKNPNTYRALARAKARRERQDHQQGLVLSSASPTTSPTSTTVPPEAVRPPYPSTVVMAPDEFTHHAVRPSGGQQGDYGSPLGALLTQEGYPAHSTTRAYAIGNVPASTGSSILADPVGSSSRSGGSGTMVPSQGHSSVTDASSAFRSTHDANILESNLRMRGPLVSATDLSMLVADADHALPTILDADDASNLTSPVRTAPGQLLHERTANNLNGSEAQIFSTSMARGPNESPHPSPHPPAVPRDKLYQSDFVVHQNAFLESVVNVYQVSPIVRYYEMQFGCVLCDSAIHFTELLKAKTGADFPPYMLLMCPNVFALLELWDGYDFVNQCCRS